MSTLRVRPIRVALVATSVVCVILAAIILNQIMTVRQAHTSFQNYYMFRGCQQLLSKTDNDATCRLASGKVIKIVKYQNKWYLDGDLPVCWFGHTVCL